MESNVIFAKFCVDQNVQIIRIETPHPTVVFDASKGFVRFLSKKHESFATLNKKYQLEIISEDEFAHLFTDFMKLCNGKEYYKAISKLEFYQHFYPKERPEINKLIVSDWTSQCKNISRGVIYNWIGRWVAMSGYSEYVDSI
jgi:hypothetical protein